MRNTKSELLLTAWPKTCERCGQRHAVHLEYEDYVIIAASDLSDHIEEVVWNELIRSYGP